MPGEFEEADMKTIDTPEATASDATSDGGGVSADGTADNNDGGGAPAPQAPPGTPLGQLMAFKTGIGAGDNQPKDMFGRPIYNAIVGPYGTTVPPGDKATTPSVGEELSQIVSGATQGYVNRQFPSFGKFQPGESNAEHTGRLLYGEISRMGRTGLGQVVPGIGWLFNGSKVMGTAVDAATTGSFTGDHAKSLLDVALPWAAGRFINPLAGLLVEDILFEQSLKDRYGNPLFPGKSQDEIEKEWLYDHD